MLRFVIKCCSSFSNDKRKRKKKNEQLDNVVSGNYFTDMLDFCSEMVVLSLQKKKNTRNKRFEYFSYK